MTLPRTDTLKPRPRLGIPTRSLAATKPVAGTVDAALIQGIPVSTIAPTAKQVVMYDAALGDYVPTTIGEISSGGSEVIISGEAQALRKGPSYVVFGTGALASGDVVIGPSGIQRMEVLTIPRVGASVTYPNGPTLTALINATQTAITLTATGPNNGQHILVDNEAMLVQSGGGTVNLVVARGRLQTAGASHVGGSAVLRVSLQAGVWVNGGLFATGGVNTTDLNLFGSSKQELLVCAKFTPTPPTATYVGNPDGDMHLHVSDHSHAADTNYRVEIDTQGAPEQGATFRWSDDGGGSWDASLVACSQGRTHLQNGVYISWDFGTYQVGSRWDFTAIGTANQVELIRADTTNDTLYLRNVNLSVTTTAHTSILTGTMNYAGSSTNVINYQNIQLSMVNADAVNQSAQAVRILAVAERGGAGLLTTVGLSVLGGSSANQSAPYTKHTDILVQSLGFDGNAPATFYGLEIANLGNAAVATSAALRIDAQTGSTALYNIWQAGTTGVNRLAAPTLIGADASPAAGVALELRGGPLRMAASANNYIQDSAGLRHITFASSTTVVAVTSSFAGDLRVNDQLGVGAAVQAGSRLNVAIWNNLGAGLHNMINVSLAGTQTADATRKSGFGFLGTYDLGGFNLPDLIGVSADLVVNDSGGTSTLTNMSAFKGSISDSSLTNQMTYASVFHAAVGGGGLSVGAVTFAGVRIENLGHAANTTTVGVDIATQSGSATVDIGLRLNANFMELSEMTAPAAGAANTARFFAEDNGSGKTRVGVQFPSGAKQIMATEP